MTGSKDDTPEESRCKPAPSKHPQKADESPGDFLYGALNGDEGDSDATLSKASKLLTSTMMNGIPLLGLDDFVRLSDIINHEIGDNGKKKILSYPSYREKFGNFVNVRGKDFRIYPRNCWSEGFLDELTNKSETFSELQFKVYDSEAAAVVDCCDDVWALIEIMPPKDHAHESCMSLRERIEAYRNGEDMTPGVSRFPPIEDDTPVPTITIRMIPSAIPDTRNYK
jgi:hypothetical protein